MPVGVLVNGFSVLLGGTLGAFIGHWIPEKISKALTNVFGLAALALGLSLIIQFDSLSPVILALIIGTIIGEFLDLEKLLSVSLYKIESKLPGNEMTQEHIDISISMIILFCFSGTGIFGAMDSAISGDHSVLITKSILDFFTALIFGSIVGYLIGAIAVPQVIIGTLLFIIGSTLIPFLSEAMIGDFKALGGIITFAVGIKISKIKTYDIINMLPSLIVVLPMSYLFSLLPF